MAAVQAIPAAGRGRPVTEDKKIGRHWADAGRLERGLDTLVEYEAGIENGDYVNIHDASIEFLGECCLKPSVATTVLSSSRWSAVQGPR